MANYQDNVEMETLKWTQLLNQAGIEFNSARFPTDYYADLSVKLGNYESPVEAKKNLLEDLAPNNTRLAVFKTIFYAVYWVMRKNPVTFITNDELNVEFRDLINQADQYGIDLPSGLIPV